MDLGKMSGAPGGLQPDDKFGNRHLSRKCEESRKINGLKIKLNHLIGNFADENRNRQELDGFIQQTYKILLSPTAKRIRGCIPALISEKLELDEKTGLLYGLVIELLHFTSLVHDDVIDNHTERRGLPTLNSQFTKRHGVLVGDYLMCEIVNYSLRFKNRAKIIQMVIHAAQDLVTGLIMEQGEVEGDLGFEWYAKMVHYKTSSLFRLSFGLPFIGDPRYAAALDVAECFGLLYQIYDDYFDRDQDNPNENIFHILSKEAVDYIIEEQLLKLKNQSSALGIENPVEHLLGYMRSFGYFTQLG